MTPKSRLGNYCVTLWNALLIPERIILVFISLALILYALVGIPLRYPISLYSQRVYHSFVFYLVGLLLTIFAVRISDISKRERAQKIPLRHTWNRYVASYLQPREIFIDLRLLHTVALMFVTYINLKHLIPYLTNTYFDEHLARIEFATFGMTATEWLINTLGLEVAPVLSALYKLFYHYTAFLIIIMVLQRRGNLRERFTSCFLLTWLIGILMVYVLPTRGPCFVTPEVISALPHTEVSEMQDKLLRHFQALVEQPDSPIPVYLISGFPSLHLAVPIIGSIFLLSVSRVLAYASWTFVLLTCITTIYFGWHYLLDDIGSIFLAAIALYLSTWLHQRK